MADNCNRAPDRYMLPSFVGCRDTSHWVEELPFFLGSAVKYIWRGWDHIGDLQKAEECLVRFICCNHSVGEMMSKMRDDLLAVIALEKYYGGHHFYNKEGWYAKCYTLLRLSNADVFLALSNVKDRKEELNCQKMKEANNE